MLKAEYLNKVVVTTVNRCGELFTISTDDVYDLICDWNGERKNVPEDSAAVYFAYIYDIKFDSSDFDDFGDFMQYVRNTTIIR